MDTSICVGALRRVPDVERRLRAFDPSELVLSVITVVELRLGAGLVRTPQVARQQVDALIDMFDVLTVTREIAERAAGVGIELRRRGISLGDFDLLIAATAMTYDYLILTNNRRFFAVPSLGIQTGKLVR